MTIRADEAAADSARRLFRTRGLVAMPADEQLASVLNANEVVLGSYRRAQLQAEQPGSCSSLTGDGPMYLTSARLILLGETTTTLDLEKIAEAGVSRECLHLLLRDGGTVSLGIERPRLLMAKIAAARAAMKAGHCPTTAPREQSAAPREPSAERSELGLS